MSETPLLQCKERKERGVSSAQVVSRGACLACEAVVSKDNNVAGLLSACAFSCEASVSIVSLAEIEVAV